MATITGIVTTDGIYEVSAFGASATGLVAGDNTDVVYGAFYESVVFRIAGTPGTTPSIKLQGSADGVNFSNLAAAATTTGIFNVGSGGYPLRFPFLSVSATGSASMDIAVGIIGFKPASIFG